MNFKDLNYSSALKFYDTATERIFKFIVLLNTGGLIACITFISNPENKINLLTPSTLFIAGLVSSAIAIALEFIGNLINLIQVKLHEKKGTKLPVTMLDYIIAAILLISGIMALIFGLSGALIIFCKAKTLYLSHV